MARYYRFSKPVSDESAEILKEMRDLENIKMARKGITEDRAYLEVETLDDIYSGVMSAAVNICSRIAHGCEVSFAKFGIQ